MVLNLNSFHSSTLPLSSPTLSSQLFLPWAINHSSPVTPEMGQLQRLFKCGALSGNRRVQIGVQPLAHGMTTLSLSLMWKIKWDISNSPVNVVSSLLLKTTAKAKEIGNSVEIVLQQPKEKKNTLGRKSVQQYRRLLRDQAVSGQKIKGHLLP